MDLFADAPATRVAVLGSTGSVGRQAIDVVRSSGGRLELAALAAARDSATLIEQAKEFGVAMIGLADGALDAPSGVEAVLGERAAAEVAERCDAEVVLNAVVGAAGLDATLATLASGKTLALANKESLVAAGEFVMSKAAPGQIRPVDSEHSALWQVLEGTRPSDVRKVWLTGTGGPFRGKRAADLQSVTVEEALAHPVWDMGRKITVDSATLMNKGLEVIEAHFLFGFTYDEIEVVIHPEGIFHAVVELTDTTVLAHAAVADMRLPIGVALLWPERSPVGAKRLELTAVSKATFEPPDIETFPSLRLAYEAGRKGDTYPAALNAANEVAVAAFLDGRIGFSAIPSVVESVLSDHDPLPPRHEEVLEVDRWARSKARDFIAAGAS